MNWEPERYNAPDFTQECFVKAPDAAMAPAPQDSCAPALFHSMSIYPEYFKIGGRWLLAEESRMDCVPVYDNGRIEVKEIRRLKKGELVITGRSENGEEGIYVHPDGFAPAAKDGDVFAFRKNRSRETSFGRDYDELCGILRHDRERGRIVWVMGPAFSFDAGCRDAFSSMIEAGYVHAVLAGNALATHDLEAAWLRTALGQNIYTQKSQPNGHYNHLDTINRVRACGGIPAFIEKEGIKDGIIYSCEKKGVPYVLAGSIRDDGPLPPVVGDVYEAQDRMRAQVKGATTVVCVATMLHSIAVGNMTPSYRVLADGTVRPVYFYCVDASEFTINKLCDRGSLSARGIVTNAQDFIANMARRLGL